MNIVCFLKQIYKVTSNIHKSYVDKSWIYIHTNKITRIGIQAKEVRMATFLSFKFTILKYKTLLTHLVDDSCNSGRT